MDLLTHDPSLDAINDVTDSYAATNLYFVATEETIAQSVHSNVSRGTLYDGSGASQMKICIKWVRGQHLDDQRGEEARALVRWEIATLARMNHPNVVSLLGLVQENPNPASPQFRCFGLVFPYIEHDLLSYMSENPAEAYLIAHQVGKALQYIRSQDMVHGGLRHNNVRITADGVVQVIGFGSSRVAGVQGLATEYTTNPRFFAPELFPRDLEGPPPIPTYASDIFSFGVLLYQIFDPNRRDPYGFQHHRPIFHLLMAIHDGQRPERTQLHPDNIWDLISTCWSGDVNQRPSIDQVVVQLQA